MPMVGIDTGLSRDRGRSPVDRQSQEWRIGSESSHQVALGGGDLATVLTASLIGVAQTAQVTANLAFTGRLEGGRLVKVARGLQPRDPCRSAARQVSWSVKGPRDPQGPTARTAPTV